MCKTTAEWLEMMRNDGIWAGPVYGFTDVVDDTQVKVNGSFVEYDHHTKGRPKTPGFPIRFQRTPAEVGYGAANAGERTREILRGPGYSAEEIYALAGAGFGSAP